MQRTIETEQASVLPNFVDFHPDINSDHAEIRVDYHGLHFASLNISNRHMHGWFSYKNWYYGRTHLFVNSGDNSDPRVQWLNTKHLKQIANIASAMRTGAVDVFCIQEAYLEFIEDLKTELGYDEYAYYYKSPPAVLPNGEVNIGAYRSNINLVITSKARAKTMESGYYETVYQEPTFIHTGRGNFLNHKDTDVCIPWVTVAGTDGVKITCYSVHIKGNESQNPKVGIAHLFSHINAMARVDIHGVAIALGDYNTVTQNLTTAVTELGYEDVLRVVKPVYPTHLNTKNKVCVFDNVVVASYQDRQPAMMHTEYSLPGDSLYLVRALKQLLGQ